jgi:HSP20 family molecular chaperone IbpA
MEDTMNLVSFPLQHPARGFAPLLAGPAYDLEQKGDDAYVLTLAVPGFGEADLDIAVEGRRLTVKGDAKAPAGDANYIRKGISLVPFSRSFGLAEHVQVKDAKLENGLLRVELAREVPEAMKPRRIAVNAPSADQPVLAAA